MPIYEYQCKKCKSHTEAFQKTTDKPLAKCPKCGGRLEKLISAPAIQFKGSGWYVTDYAGKGASEKTESESASEDKSSEKKSEKKTKDGSPATKSSAKNSSSKVPSGD